MRDSLCTGTIYRTPAIISYFHRIGVEIYSAWSTGEDGGSDNKARNSSALRTGSPSAFSWAGISFLAAVPPILWVTDLSGAALEGGCRRGLDDGVSVCFDVDVGVLTDVEVGGLG